MSITITLPSFVSISTKLQAAIEPISKCRKSKAFKVAKYAALAGAIAYLLAKTYTTASELHEATMEKRRQEKKDEEERQAEVERLRREAERTRQRREGEARDMAIQKALDAAREKEVREILQATQEKKNQRAEFKQNYLLAHVYLLGKRKLCFRAAAAKARQTFKSVQRSSLGQLILDAALRGAAEASNKASYIEDAKARKERYQALREGLEKTKRTWLPLVNEPGSYSRRKRTLKLMRVLNGALMRMKKDCPGNQSVPCLAAAYLLGRDSQTFTLNQAQAIQKRCVQHPGCISLIKVARQEKRFKPFLASKKKDIEALSSSSGEQPKTPENAKAGPSKLAIPPTAPAYTISTFSPLTFLAPRSLAKNYVLPADYRTSGEFAVDLEAAVMEVLAREFKYWLTNRVAGPKAPEFKPGIKSLTPIQRLEVDSQVQAMVKARCMPMEFMAQPNWSGERKKSVEKQIAFLRTREKLISQGVWQEKTPEEKAAIKAAKQQTKDAGKSVDRNITGKPKGNLTAKPSMPIEPKKPVPPVIGPPPAPVPFLEIQEEQLAAAAAKGETSVTFNVTDSGRKQE